MKSHKSRQSLQRLVIRWGVPMALLVAAGSPPGKTQITSLSASDPDSLGTLVNGSEGGSCSSGICAITGGTAKDNKLFHRLSVFWADSGISKVTIDNDQSSNNPYQSVILSNIDSYGTYIDTSVEFTTSKSDLVILSPGGIAIDSGAKFSNIGSIALSTSDQLRIGEQTFHFLDSSASDIDSFGAAIELIQNNFLNSYSDGGEIDIVIEASEQLTIDGDLLLHGIGGVYIESDNDGQRATLNVANSLDIQSKGNSIETNPAIEATTLYDVDIQAKSVKIDSTGSGVQPQALWIKNTQIKSTDGDINLKGISGDETTGGEDDVRGIVIEAQSSLIADTGDIILQGEAGDGDGQTVTETYTWEEDGSTYTASETFDVAVGRGIEINESTIEAKGGTIDIDAVASNGSIVFYGHGADLRDSKLEADKIQINGTSAKSTSDTKYSHGISLDTTTLLGVSGIDLVGQSGHQEANGPDGEQVSGIQISNSELTNTSGQLTMTGTGGSGTILDDSEGINIESTTIRAAAIDLNGTGGKAAQPNQSDRSLGIRIRQSTLDTSSTSLTLTSEANGNIVLKGTGGSGQDDLSGVSIIDTSTVDSAGSIEITGTGGSGDTLKYVNGVFIRGDDYSADTPTYTKLKANKKISINGIGGVGTKNDQSSGVKIEYAEIESDELIEIEGVGGTSTGTSTGAENRTGFVDGVNIWDSTISANASDAEITTANPYGATLRVDGSAGRADGYVKEGSGVNIQDSTLNTTGVLHLDGDGGSSSSKISEYSNGIYAFNGTIQASSVQIEGKGGSSTSLDALNAEGQRIDQISRGVYLNNTSIKAATGSTNHDGAISINGEANEGNTDLTGIELRDSTTLDAETSINLIGKGGSASTNSDWAAGIRLYKADLDAGTTISLEGTGGKGYGTSNLLNFSEGIKVDQSTISQTGEQGSVIIKGIAGTSEGELKDANGVMLYGSTVDTQGTLEIDGKGGQALTATNVRGVSLDDTSVTTSAALKLKGEGGVATTSSTESSGIDLWNADLTALSIEMDGSGGTAAKSSTQSTDLFGIFIGKSRISTTADNINTGNITLKGNGGVGYRYLNGVMIENSSVKTDQDIVIEGTAGTGEKVEFANGVAIQSYTVYDEEGNAIAQSASSTLEADNLSITGDGGIAEISATEAQGIVLENSNLNLTGSINLQGTGGSGSSVTSEEKAEFNNGLFLRENKIKTGADFNIVGTAGTGGDFVIGSLHEKNTYDIYGNASIKGTGGSGQDVRDSFGIGIDRDTWLVNGKFTVHGTGGSGVKTKNAYGSAIRLSKLSANTIDISGTGGNSTDTQNSRENYGTALQFSTVKSIGGDISISGKGGTGGEDDTGIVLASVNLNSAEDINIEGEGGAGDIVKFSRGIGLYSDSAPNFNDYDDDIENADNLPVSLTEFESIEYEGTTWYENSINAVNVSLKGKGGTAENKNESGSNQGVFVEDSNFNLTGNLEVDGTGGDGGSLVTGVETVYSDFTIKGNVLIKGNGGKGDIIRFAEGILIWDSDFNVSGNQIQLDGRGGTGSKIRDGIGIELDTTDIVSLNSDATIQLNGFGGVATNKIDSKDNTGIKLSNVDIIGGRYQNIIGVGGNGGKKNNGLLVRNTLLKAESGHLTLSGTGGEGINIQKGSGIVIDADLSVDNSSAESDSSQETSSAVNSSSELKARSIKMEGSGGTSVITKNAINEQGEDTFNQTAENRGIRIQNAEITAHSGQVSLLGHGGTLLVDGIKNPDKDSEVTAISQASDLEGVSLKDVSSTSTQWTYIGGQAGQPIAGNKNSGTTILSSTIRTATESQAATSDLTITAKAKSMTALQDNRIEGNAFSGTNDNYGLTIDKTTIESTNRPLTLAGQGGLKATGAKNYGIYIRNGSSIRVGSEDSSHNLNIYGAGGDGTDMTGGILSENTSYKGSGKIIMVGTSSGSGELSDSIEIFNNVSIESDDDTDISGNNNVNISDSSVDTGGDLNLSAEEDLNINESEISTDENLNAAAGDDINIDNSEIDAEGNVDVTAGNDITVADSEIESNSTTLEADTVEIEDTSLSSDQNLEIIAISGLDITSSELDASDAIALNSYSIAVESSTVTTTDLDINSTELVQKESGFEANSYSINNEQNSDDNSSGALQSLGLDVNSSLQSAGSQANDSAPTQSNSELTMSLAGGVNYILDDSAQESSSNDSQTSTTTRSSETNSSTSASTGSDEGSSGDNESVSSDASSSDSESESEQAKSGDDDQESKDDADSSKDQKTTKRSYNRLPSQKLTVKQTKQIHQQSEAQSSKFVASQLGLPERPAMTIQEIQGMLTSGMASMNKSSQ